MRNQHYREIDSDRFGVNARPDLILRMSDRMAVRIVWGIQLIFFLIALPGLNGPFVSAHFERQNQTYDIARHIFQTGWSGIVVPKASFSLPGYTGFPFTVARLEFPFYGLVGWPFAIAFGHERAVVRLIAIAFSLLSIYLMFRILRHWLEPFNAAIGAALWAFSPLVLHFGQVPMPDILCTTGLMLAFYLALQDKPAGSSAAFAFAVLAKESIVPFGLPVLATLLVTKNIRTAAPAMRTALVWGAAPAALLLSWLSLDYFGPRTPWTLLQTANDSSRGPLGDLLRPHFYVESVACVLPFGVGVIGIIALYFACIQKGSRMDRWMKLSILFATLFYLVVVVRKVFEPQYFLPLLFWLVLAASFGFAGIRQKLRSSLFWRVLLIVAATLHVIVVWSFASDLKASRVPDYVGIESAAQLLPPGTRVAVICRSYGASPAVWLNRNVETISPLPADLGKSLPYLESMNFGYLMIIDLESRHSRKSSTPTSLPGIAAALKLVFTGRASAEADPLTHFSNPASPTRQYCDANFHRLFESPSAVLYRLPRATDRH